MKVTITTTTIHVPYLIEDYIKDVIKYNRQDYVDFVITGDKKLPRRPRNIVRNCRKNTISPFCLWM